MRKKIIQISMEDLEEFETKGSSPKNQRSDLENWDPRQNQSTTKQPVDIILCIDTSGSMEAMDYPPTRLDAAKQAARMFANRKILQNYNDRVGVIGFGGTATMYQPLDSQLEKVSASIDRLQITHSGTMIGSSLHLAHTELMKAGTKRGAIVLLSDGGDEYDSSNPIQAASSFKSIKVFTVGIGTAKGADVRLPIGIKRVKLNESILRRIAKVTGGEYLYAPDIEELRKIYLKFADY